MTFPINNPYFIGLTIFCAANLILALWNLGQFRRYQKIQKELLAGEEGRNLETMVLQHKRTLANHNKNLKELGKILEELVERNHLNIQKVSLVKFNPFAESGGNMSFVLALLDGKDNGIVISSLHGREGTRIYAKHIEQGKSATRLMEEEKQAIADAKNFNN